MNLEVETRVPKSLQEILGQLPIADSYFAGRKTISIEIAKALMSKRDGRFQRALKPKTKLFIKGQLQGGLWIDDSVITIGFVHGSEDFFVLNGQHRLSVLSSSKGKDEMIVLLHILEFHDEESVMAYATTAVDANAQRSPVDQLDIAGLIATLNDAQKPLKKYLQPALHLIWSRMKGKGGGTEIQMPMSMKVDAFKDWLPFASQYVQILPSLIDTEPERKKLAQELLKGPYVAVGMVTFRSQREKAKEFWKAIVRQEPSLEGFWNDVLRADVRQGEGPVPRNPQSLIRATAGAFDLFVLGQSADSWEAIEHFLIDKTQVGPDAWHEAPLLLYGSPYDGLQDRIYAPQGVGPSHLNAQTQWTLPLPTSDREEEIDESSVPVIPT